MPRPVNPRTAGSSVTAAVITARTAAMAPKASPYTNEAPSSVMPSSEITTVHPANTTARPEMANADATADRGAMPACRRCR